MLQLSLIISVLFGSSDAGCDNDLCYDYNYPCQQAASIWDPNLCKDNHYTDMINIPSAEINEIIQTICRESGENTCWIGLEFTKNFTVHVPPYDGWEWINHNSRNTYRNWDKTYNAADLNLNSRAVIWSETGYWSYNTEITKKCFICNHPGNASALNSPMQDYIQYCNGDYKCADVTIYCPPNADCHIICNGTGACQDTNIIWSKNVSISSILTCNGTDSCLRANKAPIYAPNDDVDFYLNCTRDYQCYESIVYCPKNARCDIKCNGISSCEGTSFVWPDNNNPYNLECGNADYSCSRIQYSSYNDNIPIVFNCSADNMCRQSIFNCPLNSDCNITCIGKYSCYDSIVNFCNLTDINSKCKILCINDSYSCNNLLRVFNVTPNTTNFKVTAMQTNPIQQPTLEISSINAWKLSTIILSCVIVVLLMVIFCICYRSNSPRNADEVQLGNYYK